MYRLHFKRFFDMLLSIVLMVIFSWIFFLIVTLYVFSFQFPVIFKQIRVGKDEKLFTLLKFRTLKEYPVSHEERKFWLGNILRFTSLDELPQLLNVISGDMSLIGPRPLPIEYLRLFSPEQKVRHQVKPGITGWAQVNGRHSISWQEKFKYDVFYVQHVSFLLDLKIMMKTIALLLSFNKDISLDEEKFKGNA
jgi:undecaprenyl phosphate N,N'-diacetylbacillosamine 1-phosphate transferase